MSAKRVYFDTLRTLGFASISATYAAVGTATTVEPRIMCITNDTDAGMIFSTSSTNATGNFYIPKGSYRLFDFTANMNPQSDDSFVLPKNTTIYVKQAAAPTTGAVYVEYAYGTV